MGKMEEGGRDLGKEKFEEVREVLENRGKSQK